METGADVEVGGEQVEEETLGHESLEENGDTEGNDSHLNKINATQDYQRFRRGFEILLPILPSGLQVQHRPSDTEVCTHIHTHIHLLIFVVDRFD